MFIELKDCFIDVSKISGLEKSTNRTLDRFYILMYIPGGIVRNQYVNKELRDKDFNKIKELINESKRTR